MVELIPLFMVLCVFGALVFGYPVAFTLAGVSLLFAVGGDALGVFNLSYLNALPGSIYGVMTSDLLIAVPLFVFMGIVLERSKIAEDLLETMEALFGNVRGGLGISVILVGAMLAASTGIVGATVVTMGMISLPTMLKSGYDPKIACGTICASGTLGQIIPPSIVLILLADQMSSAWQTAQLNAGTTSPIPVSISDLFVAALIPGIGLVIIYMLWQSIYGFFKPEAVPCMDPEIRKKLFAKGVKQRVLKVLVPPLALIGLVLGSILGGVATATESAAVGAVGAMILAAFKRELTLSNLKQVMHGTMSMSCMVFMILIGAAFFTLVFRGYGGDELVHQMLSSLPGGLFGAMLVTMIMMFFLGFFLDFIQIVFVMVPIVAPVLLGMGADPIWLAIMMAINLQTSFLTPPFGFALFYLRGVAPKEVKTTDIYRGVLPFVAIQLLVLSLIAAFPKITTTLPDMFYGTNFDSTLKEMATHQKDEAAKSEFELNPDNAPSWAIDF